MYKSLSVMNGISEVNWSTEPSKNKFITKSRGSGVAKLTLLGDDEVWNIRAEFEKFNDVIRENFCIISLGECIDQGKEHQLLKQQPPNLSGL